MAGESGGELSAGSFALASPFQLESGKTLTAAKMGYASCGTLDARGENAILVMHGLFGHPQLCGEPSGISRSGGWWNVCVGPGRLFDPARDFLVCVNHLGGCHGSTGPASVCPASGKPYRLDFPVLTMRDLVRAQRPVMEALGIRQWKAVVGCSMGSLAAMQWMVEYPGTARKALLVTGIPRSPSVRLALNYVLRRAALHGAAALEENSTPRGLALAVMVGLLFWGAPERLEQRFGNRPIHGTVPQYRLENSFAIERFLELQARKYLESIDPLSLVYLSRAMDYYDLGATREELVENLRGATGEYSIVSYEPDLCYPASAGAELAAALREAGHPAEQQVIQTPYGHSAFLFDAVSLAKAAGPFLGS